MLFCGAVSHLAFRTLQLQPDDCLTEDHYDLPMPPRRAKRATTNRCVPFARTVVLQEAKALSNLARSLGAPFEAACDLILHCASRGGTVLVTGLGKSGLVGAKISATFASLGLPSHSVHPSEAAHGDLGRFRPTDLVIAISNSGETDEVVNLAAILKQDGLPIIAITGPSTSANSSLAKLARVHLCLQITSEAGSPEFIAPTSSTTATIALGDALALACAQARSFTQSDFAKRHPGGTLGGMLRRVTDVMRWKAGTNLPLIDDRLSIAAALEQAASAGRRPGALVLVNARTGKLSGIFTDGDLRRLVLAAAAQEKPNPLQGAIRDVMTTSPRTLSDKATLRDAVLLFRQFRQDEAPVIDARGKPVGMLDVQDLVALRLISDDGSDR